jgi:SOS response regulatory protein OraA/RecX
MLFWKTKNRIEPKLNFQAEIEEYFLGVSKNRIPTNLLNEIISRVTEEIYSDYKRFWKQYPKSRKRYSKLKIEDIEHSFVRYRITDFLKTNKPTEYRDFSKILFNMTDEEFDEYEKHKYWYENK